MPKFGTKNALFGYSKAEMLKKIDIFETNTLQFVNKFLARTVNVGIGFVFSEGPGLGPGPLYKVCQGKPKALFYRCFKNFDQNYFNDELTKNLYWFIL